SAEVRTLTLHDALPIWGGIIPPSVKAFRRPRLAVLPAAAILLVLGGVWLFLPVRFLEIIDEQSGRRYGLFPAEEDARIRLSWIRSEEHTSELQSRENLV